MFMCNIHKEMSMGGIPRSTRGKLSVMKRIKFSELKDKFPSLFNEGVAVHVLRIQPDPKKEAYLYCATLYTTEMKPTGIIVDTRKGLIKYWRRIDFLVDNLSATFGSALLNFNVTPTDSIHTGQVRLFRAAVDLDSADPVKQRDDDRLALIAYLDAASHDDGASHGTNRNTADT